MAGDEATGTLSLIVSEPVVSEPVAEPPAGAPQPGERRAPEGLERHGPGEWLRRQVITRREVDLATVQNELHQVSSQIDGLLSAVPEPTNGRFHLTGVEVGLSITGQGSIGIATVGGEVSLSLTYSRTT